MSIAMNFFNINVEDPCYAICFLCNKLIKRSNANSYSIICLLKILNLNLQIEVSETKKSSSSNKSVSDSSSKIPKQWKLTAMNKPSIENYRPFKQPKLTMKK